MDDPLHPGTTKTLLIVHHSMTGGTRQMVEAAARGAASEPIVRVHLVPAPAARAADLPVSVAAIHLPISERVATPALSLKPSLKSFHGL